MPEPFSLRNVKQEIEQAAANGSLPLGLSKMTIHARDAIWMVEQVELLIRIAEAFKSTSRRSIFQPYSHKDFKRQNKNTGGENHFI
jgi:hypothetical protein